MWYKCQLWKYSWVHIVQLLTRDNLQIYCQ